MEGAHDSLSCHACHPFELEAQTKEMYYWIMERPDKVPPHAKVPRETCEQCHVQGAAKDTWQRIASTAGHRIHFESDSSALKDVACLTCHARTAHRFQPADTTCAQQGCHLTDEVKIRLGSMAARFSKENLDPNEEQLYCNSCHQFTADAQFVTLDSASGALRPGQGQCFGCHEMRTLFATFDPAKDPHGGSCGMCHNPHTDVKPADAMKSCADAGCHANWRSVAFHAGKAHQQGGRAVPYLPPAARGSGGCERLYRVSHRGEKGRWPEQTASAVRHAEGPAGESAAGGAPTR